MNKRIKLINGTELTMKQLITLDTQPHIMTLLKENKIYPEDVPEELLHLTNSYGQSVFDVCVEKFREPMRYNKNSISLPRAFVLASVLDHGQCRLPIYFRTKQEILKIIDSNDGYSVAHVLARSNLLPEESMTEDILKQKDFLNCAVAYEVAKRGNLPNWATKRKDILILEDGYENYVAHLLAEQGTLPIEMMTPDILQMEDKDAITVFDTLIQRRQLTPEILKLPWDNKKAIFEQIQTEKFKKRKQILPHLEYLNQELHKYFTYQLTQQLACSSVSNNLEMER